MNEPWNVLIRSGWDSSVSCGNKDQVTASRGDWRRKSVRKPEEGTGRKGEERVQGRVSHCGACVSGESKAETRSLRGKASAGPRREAVYLGWAVAHY